MFIVCLYGRFERASCQFLIGFDILGARFFRDIGRQFHTRAGFVELDIFQIISHKLFVKAFLIASGLILVGGPEPRRIRREHFVDQDNTAVDLTPLKLGVGQQYPFGCGIDAGLFEYLNALVANVLGLLFTD